MTYQRIAYRDGPDLPAMGFCDVAYHLGCADILRVLGEKQPLCAIIDQQPNKFTEMLDMDHASFVGERWEER